VRYCWLLYIVLCLMRASFAWANGEIVPRSISPPPSQLRAFTTTTGYFYKVICLKWDYDTVAVSLSQGEF
jgi:hypothetical protein